MTVEYLGQPLTLERVQAAYAKTGLTPRVGAYFSWDPDSMEDCACALGAVAVAEGFCRAGDGDAVELNAPVGFIAGFDQVGAVHDDDREAYALGAKIRRALFPALSTAEAPEDWAGE